MSEKAKVPAIRFKGFSDDWEQRKLGMQGKCQSGIGFPDSEQGGKDGIPFYKVSDMNNFGNENEMTNANHYVTKEQINRNRWKPIDDLPAVIFAKVGAAIMLNRKRLCVAPFLLDNNTMAFIFDQSWDTDFGRTFFENIDLTKLVQVGALPSYNASDVENLKIFITNNKSEQNNIGSFFSNVDSLITLHQRKLIKLKNVKKAMLEKMFPKEGSDVPEIRFAGFTDPWIQRKLWEVVDVRGGKDYKNLSEGDIPVYGTGGYMLSVNEALSYKENAIGIGRKGTIDKPYILKAPFWTVDTLFYAVPRENYDLDFVFDLFQNIDWKKKDESTGVPSLSKTTINEIDVIVPEENEQKVVGAFFARIDNLITLQQRKVEKLKNIKKACLEKMFV